MSDSTNYGIVGDVHAQNLVVGPNGRIDAGGATQLTDGLAALTRAVEAHEGPAETRAQLAAAVDDVAEELQRPTPDKDTLSRRLATLGAVSGTASAVAAAASGLLSVIERVV
jgi:hypothetical protein